MAIAGRTTPNAAVRSLKTVRRFQGHSGRFVSRLAGRRVGRKKIRVEKPGRERFSVETLPCLWRSAASCNRNLRCRGPVADSARAEVGHRTKTKESVEWQLGWW